MTGRPGIETELHLAMQAEAINNNRVLKIYKTLRTRIFRTQPGISTNIADSELKTGTPMGSRTPIDGTGIHYSIH